MPRILIIEDEQALRANLCRLLTLEGHAVVDAQDGEIGVELARRERPELIICDIRMPRLDGFGVLAALRGDPATAGIPFIFLTASAETSDRRLGLVLGADEYLTKPFKLPELLSIVSARLARSPGAA